MAKKEFNVTASDFMSVPAATTKQASTVPDAITNEVSTSHAAPAPDGYVVPEGYKLVRAAKSERIQLLVRPDIKDKLKDLAAAEGVSMNELANRIFEFYFAAQQ